MIGNHYYLRGVIWIGKSETFQQITSQGISNEYFYLKILAWRVGIRSRDRELFSPMNKSKGYLPYFIWSPAFRIPHNGLKPALAIRLVRVK